MMPLNRDGNHETAENAVLAGNDEPARSHSRKGSLTQQAQPSTPRTEIHRTSRREVSKPIPFHAGQKHHIPESVLAPTNSTVNPFKIPPNDTMKGPANSVYIQPARFQSPSRRPEEKRSDSKTTKQQVSKPQEMSSFDHTGSLDQSFLDDDFQEDKTAILRSERFEQHSTQPHTFDRPAEAVGRDSRLTARTHQDITLGPGWQDDVHEERHYLANKENPVYTLDRYPKNDHSMLPNQRSQFQPPPIGLHDREEPGTPSRTQSAPPVNQKVHAPIARTGRNVNFAAEDQVMNISPMVSSEDMAREDSFGGPPSRPSSTQPRSTSIPVHAKQYHVHQDTQINAGQKQASLPTDSFRNGRFKVPSHSVRQENPKVSAPESDNQDFSEDERVQGLLQHHSHESLREMPVGQPALTKKRSYDDMTDSLDYSPAELRLKTLAELQAEPFPQDPRLPRHPPPINTGGAEIPLPRILENLSKVSTDTQRETFRTLTDEEWARTGQWFVDKFQSDLKELVEIRTERRKVAMKYEDRIRRRQLLVKHCEAEVDKELGHLQSGGKQLVDARKVPNGSRSNTPLKSGR